MRTYSNHRNIDAFEDFLTNYESSGSDPENATDALENLNINEDGLSDEYVMVDDERERPRNQPKPSQFGKKKYMNILQKVADRQISEIAIDLDDLSNVSLPKNASNGLDAR